MTSSNSAAMQASGNAYALRPKRLSRLIRKVLL